MPMPAIESDVTIGCNHKKTEKDLIFSSKHTDGINLEHTNLVA